MEAAKGERISISQLAVRYGNDLAVKGVSFDVEAGEHLTLLGPSGCGKTTTLRSIAGLEKPSEGTIKVDDRVLFSSADRINVPTENRGISMVFQSYAIWPHMSVFENVAYGLRIRKASHADTADAVRRALDLVQMAAYADRPASRLSGGQQQRVSLARAIAFSPGVILFDEPLSNLDAKLRTEMREELRSLRDRLQITSVYVTHDQEEALAISDRIVVMNRGLIEQIGTPEAIYDRPCSRFVADFVGSANLVRGKVVRQASPSGDCAFEAGGQLLRVTSAADAVGEGDAEIAIRPAYVTVTRDPPKDADSVNVLPGVVQQRMFHGDFIQYRVRCAIGDLVARAAPTENYAEGEAVSIVLRPTHCVLLGQGPRSSNHEE
jgi:ABC-type Fe3+/spermidine/putrescine transport system ATPase subunit